MSCNVGGIDRLLRIIVGAAILSLFYFKGMEYGYWPAIGAVPLLTGLIGWCPAYAPLGISSCKR